MLGCHAYLVFSVSLSISIASGALMVRACYICLSVGCPESVLWQNGQLDPDVVWGGEWGRSRDGCIRWGW